MKRKKERNDRELVGRRTRRIVDEPDNKLKKDGSGPLPNKLSLESNGITMLKTKERSIPCCWYSINRCSLVTQ